MSRKDSAIVRNPVTGETTYRLNGETVNRETFIATAVAQAVSNVIVIFLVAKGLGISKRRAWALVAGANAWRAMWDMRVDVASKPEAKPGRRVVDADEIARRLGVDNPFR